MDPGLSFVQGVLQTEEQLWPAQAADSSPAMLGNELNYNHAYRTANLDYDPVGLREEDYCPYCQKSEVLRNFCSCVNAERGQRADVRCDCAHTCSCVTCKPWREQNPTSLHPAAERGRSTVRFAPDTDMTSQVNDRPLSSLPPSALAAYRRRQSHSLHSNADREREMAMAAHESGIRNVRRRTMSAGVPRDMRVFLKHSSFCECRGSGVGCQCGRICYCD
ncbi:hypothetical protein SYNPS1DRAFT_22956 [Syncephalis pseudoplumigaleata]|uniref:Uncharacterized protein n=1 Tax=Syncephalis pseudoplumigaleata TaxID=1712513 RepID=A0A4P9YY59_9FUNG|nr:hypothetical protein SYNPS1DRAFT_22956 [Syncephalis pseudoplumigaleata]|eukprot:RKP25017.1 hypothetical protein SYNPS1DRAFT_22956 [Syncephalis pseudoplumigaleata]